MSEFLSGASHTLSKIDEVVAHAKEFVYLASPTFAQAPASFFTKLWEAQRRGVRVILLYREASLSEQEVLSLQNSRILLYHHPDLSACAYLNEKEAVITSLELFAAEPQVVIMFGVYLRKLYGAAMYGDLLNEVKRIQGKATKMVVDDSRLVSAEEVVARRQMQAELNPPPQEDVAPVASTKKLTIKEKQDVILKLFARDCKDCTIKTEDAERLRVYGKGIVLAVSKERVDMIFVHYDAYQSRMEEVKQFITAKCPDMKVWFQYNRINMKLETESEIALAFTTLIEAVSSFGLITQP